MRFLALLNTGLLVAAVGCGGGDSGGDYGDPIPNAQAEAAGTESVNGAAELSTLGVDPANEGAVGKSFAVYSSLSQMASIKQSSGTSMGRILGNPSAWDSTCVTVSGNTATYTQCDSGGSTIDGTITSSPTTVDINLTITTTQAEITMTGDLTFSPTSLVGTIQYDTAFETMGLSIVTTYEGIYNITLDNTGCPVGGQVEVHYTVSGGAPIDIWAKAEFGPTCGDVTFY